MSIATLKRKTLRGGNPRADPISGIGAKGFSLNGGHRNIGAVGQFRMVSNVTRTPFRGTQPMGHGGFGGEYYDVPSNSGSCCTNDDAIIKHSSLTTAGMIDEKYKWTKSQYPRYWVKDDDNANRITKTQGQLIGAKTWAAGACNFEKAANDDPLNVWECKNKCAYWIGGKKKFLYYPYAKWLNTNKVQSQGAYITAGGVARLNRLPTPACMQHYPMMLSANGCDRNAVTWQQAQAQGLLPADYMTCNPIDGASSACKIPNGPAPTQIGVDNSQNSEASFSDVTGVLTTRYSADAETVFNAVKRTIDAMPGTLRTGETDDRGSVVIYARTIGDLEINITIKKTEDEVTKAVYTQVEVKYGFFGNLPESQIIVSNITTNLR